MNILISTTSNWNPGDDFIRYGVEYVLQKKYGPNINFIHYDRNPDYFKSDAWEMGVGHKSNVMNNPIDLSFIDMVVLAGSPEWLHGPLTPLYEALKIHSNIPLVAIGVGYSFPMDQMLPLTDIECDVLSRPWTTIITRQYDLAEHIKKYTHTLATVTTLPCPGVFSSNRAVKPTYKELYASIVQAPHGPQSLSIDDYNETMEYIKGSPQFENMISHYIEDFKHFKRGFFSSDAQQLANEIARYSIVLTNRLHGGLLALGNGAEVKFINNDSRVQRALEPFSPYLNMGWYKMSDDDLKKLEATYLDLI